MTETWKPVVGYEDYYEVSDQGRVRSLDREVNSRNQHGPCVRLLRGRSMRPGINRQGYRMVQLSSSGEVKPKYVHRLVLEAFEGPCPPDHECLHINGIPSDNRLENLRWGTSSENRQDSLRHGTHHWSSKTHCVNGHEFTEDNTYRKPSRPTSRTCRTCHREREQARRDQRRAA